MNKVTRKKKAVWKRFKPQHWIMVGILFFAMIYGISTVSAQDKYFSFKTEEGMDNARYFVAGSGTYDEIKEFVASYEYTTDQGAQAVIYEVRLGTNNTLNAYTTYVKVWKNSLESKIQKSFSSEKELSEKVTTYGGGLVPMN